MKRKRKTPEERGYMPIEQAAVALRQLADDLEKRNAGRLAKIDLNIWYEDVQPDNAPASVGERE